jgi:hypothetical protein
MTGSTTNGIMSLVVFTLLVLHCMDQKGPLSCSIYVMTMKLNSRFNV